MVRDIQLDAYRALSMIYIVCVIHVLYWLNIGSDTIKSISLIEMPVIFFIAGGAASCTVNRQKTFKEIVISRFNRVIAPFYVYAFVSVALIATVSFIPVLDKLGYNILRYNFSSIVSILLCLDIPQVPNTSHLWFIVPYFVISISTSLQWKAIKQIKPVYYILINIIVYILFLYLRILCGGTANHDVKDPMNILQMILGYNIFYIMGLSFYKRVPKKYIPFIIPVMFLVYWWGGNMDYTNMQGHKFPPDLVFISYNLFVLSFLFLIFSYIKIPYNNLLKIWNNRGYTIYLYQNYIFYVVSIIAYKLGIDIKSGILEFIVFSTIIFSLSIVVSYLTVPMENMIIQQTKNMFVYISNKYQKISSKV